MKMSPLTAILKWPHYVKGHYRHEPEGPGRRGYAKAKVEVRQLLDGSWRVYYRDTLIAQTDPTPLIEPMKEKPRRK